jgi:hypothetical protein
MIPRIFRGKNIPVRNGTELRQTVEEMCAEYVSGIPEKAKEDIKQGN